MTFRQAVPVSIMLVAGNFFPTIAGADSGDWLVWKGENAYIESVHNGRLSRRGPAVEAWFRQAFKSLQASPLGLNYSTVDTKKGFVCTRSHYRVLHIVLRDADGRVVWDQPGTGAWHETLPGSLAEAEREYACDHPPFVGWVTHETGGVTPISFRCHARMARLSGGNSGRRLPTAIRFGFACSLSTTVRARDTGTSGLPAECPRLLGKT